GLQVTRYADPAKAMELTLKMFRAITENSSFSGSAIKGKPAIKMDAQKVGNISLHSVDLVWDMDKNVERFSDATRDSIKESMTKVLGSEMHLWFGTDGKVFLQATAPDWQSARQMLESFFTGKNTLENDAGFSAARKQLPAEANMLTMLDAGRLAHFITQYGTEMFRNAQILPFNLGEAQKPEGKPAYMGLAITLQPRHANLDIWVPAEAAQAVIKVLAPLLGNIN